MVELPSSNRPPYWFEHCNLVLLTLQPGTVPSLRYVLLYFLGRSDDHSDPGISNTKDTNGAS